MNLVVLRDELATDPLERDYSTMSDAEAADDLNTVYRTRTLDTLSGGVVYDQVDDTEFLALTDTEQAEVWNIAHLGAEIRVGPGSKARAQFISIFGVGSATISNLLDEITIDCSRAEELGLGMVKAGYVSKARA